MPIIEYFLLALLGTTTSAPSPADCTTTALIALGEDAIVQPNGSLPNGDGQKKPVKHSGRIWLKKGQKGSHHRRSGKGSHVKPDSFTIKQKSQQK